MSKQFVNKSKYDDENQVILAFPCISNRGRGTAFAVDEVFFTLMEQRQISIKSDGTPHQSLRDSFPY